MGIAIYVLAFAVLVVGLYAVVAKKNVVKIIVGLLVLDYAVNLLLVLIGYRSGGQAPILEPGQTSAELAAKAVDPLPQAMVLTSIVIGLGLTALMVAMGLRLYEKYGTFDTNKIRSLRG
ncbi:MAG TPA: cation:proton antiporter subunit C [Phycisphaerae bacterium]|nr:cation:proton antiporter subunit C [Phycisphaerae bacterium]